MPLIECTKGPTETHVGDTRYGFELDKYGRAVASVSNRHHVKCLLGNAYYRVVEATPAPTDPAPTDPAPKAKSRKAAEPASASGDTPPAPGADGTPTEA